MSYLSQLLSQESKPGTDRDLWDTRFVLQEVRKPWNTCQNRLRERAASSRHFGRIPDLQNRPIKNVKTRNSPIFEIAKEVTLQDRAKNCRNRGPSEQGEHAEQK